MSRVYFAPAFTPNIDWQSTLPGRLDKILERLDIASELKDKRVCIKMHLGGNVGYTTVHPVFVRRVVAFVKAAGGHPFVTDILESALTSYERGYTEETIGCPILPAAGRSDKYYHTYPVDFRNLKELHVSGEVVDADYLISLAHLKGHGCAGFGGAIKNLAVGALAGSSRWSLHMVQHTEQYWDADKCTHFADGCTICIDACQRKDMRFADDNLLHVGFHECDFCGNCNEICPTGALSINEKIGDIFQEAMGISAEAVMTNFKGGNAAFINLATNITPFCDCMGMTTPNLVPDLGIYASKDMVAVDAASLDAVKFENLLPNTVPADFPLRDVEGHLFKKIHGTDPYLQVRECEKRGLGSMKYDIEEVL
jgi:hypothetical protein